MYDRQLAIEKAEKDLKDANDKLLLVSHHVGVAENELFMLSKIELALIENLETLRSGEVIASAREYKKIKEDLVRARHQMVVLETDLKTYIKILKNAQKRLEDCHMAVRIATLIPITTVIYATFGRKNNGQS